MDNTQKINITPMEFDEFKKKYSVEISQKDRLLQLLKKDIDAIANYAIAPYFWFVSSKDIEVLDSSDNIHDCIVPK